MTLLTMPLWSSLHGGTLYLDPGSGSILLQLLLAVLLGAGVIVRSQWKRIKSFFKRGSEAEQEPEEDDEE